MWNDFQTILTLFGLIINILTFKGFFYLNVQTNLFQDIGCEHLIQVLFLEIKKKYLLDLQNFIIKV